MEIKIRVATSQHVTQIREIYRPHIEDNWASFEYDLPDEKSYLERLQHTMIKFPWLVAVAPSGQVAGYCYAAHHRSREAYQWNCELSVYIQADYARQSIAFKLYQTLFKLLDIQGYQNLLAGIALPNDASIALHRKMGFEEIGVYRNIGYKMNGFRDVSWWSKFIGAPNEVPETPTPFSELDQQLIEEIINN